MEDQGYHGSYSSVRRYVRKKKFVLKLASEGYLPLAQPCGHGSSGLRREPVYDAQGKERKGYALTVSFPQSNKGYTQFFFLRIEMEKISNRQQIGAAAGG